MPGSMWISQRLAADGFLLGTRWRASSGLGPLALMSAPGWTMMVRLNGLPEPVGPTAPVGPVAPAPVGPTEPVGPSGPVGPVGPTGPPDGPVAPVAPVGPVG